METEITSFRELFIMMNRKRWQIFHMGWIWHNGLEWWYILASCTSVRLLLL